MFRMSPQMVILSSARVERRIQPCLINRGLILKSTRNLGKQVGNATVFLVSVVIPEL
jgi:hypothetical protein